MAVNVYGHVDGRPVIITAGAANSIVIRDVDTGIQFGAPLAGHQAEVTALGVADLHGRPVRISAARDDSNRFWDLAVRAAG